MFNSLVTTLVGFFSRSFWLGHFLPVVVFGVLHLLAAKLVLGRAVDLSIWSRLNTAGDVLFAALAIMTPVVIAYALAPLIPVARGMLDGTLLPLGLHDRLRRERLTAFYAQRREWNVLAKAASTLSNRREPWAKALDQAALDGKGKTSKDRDALDAARNLNNRINGRLLEGRLPPTGDVRCAVTLMECALRAQDANGKTPLAIEIKTEWDRLIELLRGAKDESNFQLRAMRERHAGLTLAEGPQATEIGDARDLAEQYSQRVYEADFDFIWPRLQMVLKDSDPEQVRLSAAQTQVDFAVLSLVLSVTLLGWLPVAAIIGTSAWAAALIGLVAPLVILFAYRLVVASQSAFGGVVKAVIDIRRLDVLKALRQPEPATLAEERVLWNRLQAAEQAAPVPIRYHHPTKAAAS